MRNESAAIYIQVVVTFTFLTDLNGPFAWYEYKSTVTLVRCECKKNDLMLSSISLETAAKDGKVIQLLFLTEKTRKAQKTRKSGTFHIKQLRPNTLCFRTFRALYTWLWTWTIYSILGCHVGHLVGHLVHLHSGHHVHLHESHHNVVSTRCKGSETLTECKTESMTVLPTDPRTDVPG